MPAGEIGEDTGDDAEVGCLGDVAFCMTNGAT